MSISKLCEILSLLNENISNDLDFMPENVRSELEDINKLIKTAYENSNLIKSYEIPQYNIGDNTEDLIIMD